MVPPLPAGVVEDVGVLTAFCWTGLELRRFGRRLFFPSTLSPVPTGPAAGLPSRRETKPPLFLTVVSAVDTECCSCRVVPERRCLDSVCPGGLPPIVLERPAPDLDGVGSLLVERVSGGWMEPPPCQRGSRVEGPLLRLPPPLPVIVSAGGMVLESPPPPVLPAGVLLSVASGGVKSPPRPTTPSLKSSSTCTSTPRLRTPPDIPPVLPEWRRISRPAPPPGPPPPLNPPGLPPLPLLEPLSGFIPKDSV